MTMGDVTTPRAMGYLTPTSESIRQGMNVRSARRQCRQCRQGWAHMRRIHMGVQMIKRTTGGLLPTRDIASKLWCQSQGGRNLCKENLKNFGAHGR